MKPQLGDTISNRYVLVSPLREETGLQVWKASDHVLARDCQLFIVSSSKALQEVNATASMLAISHDSHFTKVLQLQHAGQVALVVTQLDEGMTLSEYLALNANQPLSYTAMRSIIGEVIESLHALQKDNLTHFSISTDTVRLTRSLIADEGPFSQRMIEDGNAGLYIKFIDRVADRIAEYICNSTVRDFEKLHGMPITNEHETFYTLIVGLISLIRLHPDIEDTVIRQVAAQTLHLNEYM